MMYSQSSKQRAEITRNYNQPYLAALQQQYSLRANLEKSKAIQMAEQKGWDVLRINSDGSYDELIRVSEEGKPIYYTVSNVNAARSTRANHLNSGGSLGLNLNGQGMTAHVWDGGAVRTSHQEYGGRVIINDGVTALNNNSFHATHVTGTIGAAGVDAAAKGMAPQATVRTSDWNSDLAEATTAASNGMLVSNHSYGFAARNPFTGAVQIPIYYFGGYIDESRGWDELMYNAPNYLMVVAAGNDGNDNTANSSPLEGNSLYDKLTGHSTSKNNLVVANAQDANVSGDGTLNSVSINSSSSEGPTDDLRIKPDITGNGTQVYSTFDNSDTAYNSITGTSMASPNVTGSLLLLQQHYNNVNGNFMRAATLKGLALHTADDAGSSGPDAIFGWGLMNTKAAAEAISQNGNESKIDELVLNPGQTYSITVDSDGVNPLIASISWTDPAGTANTGTINLSTPVLVNDLDLRVSQGGTTFNPYRLTSVTTNDTGDNIVDPYERIDVNGAAGTYTITVTHKGSLSGGSQNYSLIITGLTGTPVVCNATTPSNVSVSGIGSSEATVSWDAVPGATYDVRHRQTGTSTWTTNAVTGTTTTLSGLTAQTEYEVQVRSKCSDGTNSAYSTSVNFTTTEVQLNYCASQGNNVNDEYISRVQLGSIDNSSGSGNGYTDFTSISANVLKGTSYTITVTPTWTGTVYAEGYSVWVDYNKDGDFSDAGEQVWTQAATTSTPVSGSFTIPATAVEGATRMRVSMKYNAIPTECETFTYGEVEDYTLNIGAGTPDTEAPSVPANLTASNITQTTVDLSWTASTDNVGVTEYDVYQGANVVASVAGTSHQVTGLTADTAYSFSVRAKDAAGNESAASNAVNVTTLAGGGSTTVTLHEGFFETGLDGWIDGGGDCARVSSSFSFEGSYSVRLRDNSGTRSSMTLGSFDVSAYDEIEVKFYFYPNSMESGEDFWVRYHDGNGWNTVAAFASGTDFTNGSFYSATVTISAADYNFPSNAQFRIQCDASANADQVYIDQITIKASSGIATASSFDISSVGGFNQVNTGDLTNNFSEGDFIMYPNPVVGDIINLRLGNSNDMTYKIVNLIGQTVQSGKISQNIIQVGSLEAGIYLLEVNDGEELMTQKFIRQ
ncbi:S8 family serine peptidase [Leptobacterium flavescens]|uniref:S8 family serine peptidase n=1 Tax=Leptobacterium flavescens TaxID=472055 RepID=A0A6P0UQJ8_9FLAO|nr:S8 family serine peptidase [Leptobacterium flavescens]